MTREQMDRFSTLLLGPPRMLPGDILIRADGEPELLKPADPPFFSRVLGDRPTFTEAPSVEVPNVRHSIPESVRREVLSRDGCECYLCGATVVMDGLHFDHIIPVALGGQNTAENLGVACGACNLRKGKRLTDRRPRGLR